MTGLSVSLAEAPTIDLPARYKEELAVERILCSTHFNRAPLLSAFLTYVCRRAIEDASVRIAEHDIGVHVFHRSPEFDPREDNIVRTYARQLRKRLQEYYTTDGAQDALLVEIPRGGYVPVFTTRNLSAVPKTEHVEPSSEILSVEVPQRSLWKAAPRRWILAAIFLLLYSAILAGGIVWIFHVQRKPEPQSILHPLWMQLFNHDRDTFIVPSDIGFVILQQANKRTFSLSEYLSWFSAEGAERNLAMSYLKDLTYTSNLDLTIVSKLQRLPEAIQDRFVIRAAKNLSFEDLRDGNAILLGSSYGLPWDELFEDRLNFHFINQPDGDRYWIINTHPEPGEAAKFESVEKSFSHRTYAVLAFVPNLNKTGHVLLVQGLDAAGTQAAADMLFEGDELRSLLSKAETAQGHIDGFELLIEAQSLDPDPHATSSHIIASRFYR